MLEHQGEQVESELFTLRLWPMPGVDGVAWRGKIQHVLTGEVYYFRSWEILVEQLQKLLAHAGSRQIETHELEP